MKHSSILCSALIFAALLFLGRINLYAQTISAGPDTTICPGQSVTLTANLINLSGGPLVAPTTVPNTMGCDDCLSSAWIPLGFTFNFYGNNYTQCLISSNSYLTFSGAPGGGSPWSIGVNLPSAGAPLNMIACPWWDGNPGVGALDVIRYKTIGVAPNRVFIVEWLDVPSFSCGTATCYGAQVHLYETSNIIETHIFRYQSCTSWNSGRGIHGIQNATGAIAHVVPGRNGLNAPWYINVPGFVAAPNSAGPEGRRWTPLSSTNYNISTIPFMPVYMPIITPSGYVWSIAGGANIGTTASVTVSPSATTNYVVSIPYSGCATTVTLRDTVRVNMGTLPLTTSSAQTICYGDTTSIFANTTITGTTNYVWTPNGNITNNTLDTVEVYPTTTTTYTVTATNGLCTNTASVLVNVNPLPVIGFNPVNPQICEGSSIAMTANGANGYLWSPGSSLNTTSGATVTASPVTTTTYTVVATDVNGCIDSATNTVTFYPNPVVSISATEPSVCPGYSATLTAAGANSYVWSPAAGLNFTNIASPTATLNTAQTYTVIGTDANGCVDTADFTLLVDPLPQPSFASQSAQGCEPVTVIFNNTSTIASGAIASYLWNFESHGSSNAQNPTITFANYGDFDVQLIAISDSGCVDSITIANFVNVYSVPTAGFYATPQPTTIGDPLVNFVNTSTADAVNCAWDIGGMATSDICNPYYEFNAPGSYIVTLIASTIHGCSDTVSADVLIEDLSEIFVPNSFTPNNDGINDTWFPVGRNLNNDNTDIFVEVFNQWGDNIYFSDSSDKPWDGRTGKNFDVCPMGVYVYRVYFVNEKGKERTLMGNVNLLR